MTLDLNNTNLADLLVAHTRLIEDFGKVVQANAELASMQMDLQLDAARYQILRTIMVNSDDAVTEQHKEALETACNKLDVDLDEQPSAEIIDQVLDAMVIYLRPDSSAG